MAKKPANVLNAEDIASANLGFTIAQFALDMLIQKGLLTSKEVAEFFNSVAANYSMPGKNKDRDEVRATAAAVMRKLVAMKYSAPPKDRQH
jgi:L-arabinose isomerase